MSEDPIEEHRKKHEWYYGKSRPQCHSTTPNGILESHTDDFVSGLLRALGMPNKPDAQAKKKDDR